MTDHLSDTEVDDICAGLEQNAAKVRFLEQLGYRVTRKPNGRPLVWRRQIDLPAPAQPSEAPDRTALILHLRRNHGQKTPIQSA